MCGDPEMFRDVSSNLWGSGNVSECLQRCVGIQECLRMCPAVCRDRGMFQDVSGGVWGSGNISRCL